MGMMSRGLVELGVDGIQLDSNAMRLDVDMDLAFYMSMFTDENVVGYATSIGFHGGVEHVYRCGQWRPRRACGLRLRFDHNPELQIAHCQHQTFIRHSSRDAYWLTRYQVYGRHTHADAVRALLSPQLQLRPRHFRCQLCTGSVIG